MSRTLQTAARTAAVAVLLLGTACYRVTVVTAPEPANAVTVDKPWTHSFVYGLVPPGEVDVAQTCRGGVAKVVTQRSFLNSLVAGLTGSIYTPLQVTVTCASTRTTQLGIPPERLGVVPAPAPDSTRAAAR